MIHKNVKVGKQIVHTYLEFGKGDINVGATISQHENTSSVVFKSQDSTPIGTEDESVKGKTTDFYVPEVIMSFDKIESIDVVIEQLNHAKNYLLNREETLRKLKEFQDNQQSGSIKRTNN